MFRKKQTIKYESALEEYPNILVPTKTKIPDWYKKIPKWENNTILDENNNFSKTVKQCYPFLDTLSTGYFITLPYDLYIKNNNGRPFLIFNEGNQHPPRWRDNIANENIVPHGFFPIEYIWNICTSIEIPKSHSALFTHPLNRYDLPFFSLSGIISGGWPTNSHGNYPFYIKQGFEGIIPQGTPIIQIIPFTNEEWKSEKKSGLVRAGEINRKKSLSVISGWYKNTFWIKKKYE